MSLLPECIALDFMPNYGLHVWEIPKSNIFDFETTKDGIFLVVKTYNVYPSFNNLKIAAGVENLKGYGVMCHSKIVLIGMISTSSDWFLGKISKEYVQCKI